MSELNKYIKENCPFLLKLIQMTEKQEKEVTEKYGDLPCKMQLDKMNNWRKITNNRSVYHTLNKWFEMDIQRGNFKPENRPNTEPKTNSEKEEFLKQHPIGSKIKLNGKTFTVETNDFLINENKGFIPIADFINKFKGQSNEINNRQSFRKA